MAAGMDAVEAAGVAGGDPPSFGSGRSRRSCGRDPWSCSFVAVRASGRVQQRARGGRAVEVAVAPWWVPLGPRSCGCRSWIEPRAGGAQRQCRGAGVAVRVAESPRMSPRGIRRRASRSGRDEPRAGSCGPGHRGAAGELGRCGQFSSGIMTPAEGRSRRARPGCAAGCRGWPTGRRRRRGAALVAGRGRRIQVVSTASEPLASRNPRTEARAGRRRPLQRWRGQPAGGVLAEGRGDQAEGPLGLPVGELVRPGVPVRDHARPLMVVRAGGQGLVHRGQVGGR